MEPSNRSPHLSEGKTEESEPMEESLASDSGWQSVTNKRDRKRAKEVVGRDNHKIQLRAPKYLAKKENTSRPSQMKGWRRHEESSVQEIKINRNEPTCSGSGVRMSSLNRRKREEPVSPLGDSQPTKNEEGSEIWPKTKRGQSVYVEDDESTSQEWPELGGGHSSRKSTECKQDFSFAGRLSGNCQSKEFSYESTYKDNYATESHSGRFGAVKKTDYNWRDREAAVKLHDETYVKKRDNESVEHSIFFPRKVENTQLGNKYVGQDQSPQNARSSIKEEERKETVRKLQDETNVKSSENQDQLNRPSLARSAGQDTEDKRTSVSNKETMPGHSKKPSFGQEKDVINKVEAEVMKSTNEGKNEAVEKILPPKQEIENNWRTEQPSTVGHTDWSNFFKRSLPTWREDQLKSKEEQKVCSSYSKQVPVDTPITSDKVAASFKNQKNQPKLNSRLKKKDNKHQEVLTDSQKRKITENCDSNIYIPPHLKNGHKSSQAKMKLEGKDFPPLHNTRKGLPSAKKSANKNSGKVYDKDRNCPHTNIPCGTTRSTSKEVKTRKKQPKAKDPIFWNIIEFAKPLSALRQRQKSKKPKRVGQVVCIGGNMLDSSNPIRKRGKHRELPKMKRRTRLKSIILRERLQRRAAREALKSDCTEVVLKSDSDPSDSKNSSLEENTFKDNAEIEAKMETAESQGVILVQNILSKASTSSKEETALCHEDSVVKLALHSGKFREYCENARSPQLDTAVISLIGKLLTYQTKKHESDPAQAHSKRRLVFGMREVNKFLLLKKMKMIVVAPDLEDVPAEGGLNDAVVKIKKEASKQTVPVIFATNRRKLGYVTFKKVPVSIVGIANFEGAEEFHQEVMKNWQCAVEEYQRDYKAMLELLFPACNSSKGTKMHPEESVDQVKMISENCLSKLRDV